MEIDFGVAVGQLAIRTREGVEVVDLTARVEAFLEAAALEAGWVNVHSRHAPPASGERERARARADAHGGRLPLRTAETVNRRRGRLQLRPSSGVCLRRARRSREREV